MDHGDQRDDVEHGKPGLALDVGRVRGHVGALQHDRADVRVLRDEPPGDPHVLLARSVDVEHHLVAQEHARELLLRLHAGDGDRDIADARAGEVLLGEAGRVHGHDAHPASGWQQSVNQRDQQEARGEHRDADRRRQLALELHEESAIGGDRAHALMLEPPSPVEERGQQARGAPAHDQVGIGALHALVADRERKRRRVAHVARNPRESGVEHEDSHGESVLVEAAPDASRRHGPILYPASSFRGRVSLSSSGGD